MIKLILIKELFDETKSEAQLSDNNQKQLATCFEGKEKELERILLDKEYGDELEEMNITDRSSTSKEKCRVIFNTWSKLSHHNTCGALRETFDRYSIFSGENPLEMETGHNQDTHKPNSNTCSRADCFKKGSRPRSRREWYFNIIMSDNVKKMFLSNWKGFILSLITIMCLIFGLHMQEESKETIITKPAEIRNLLWAMQHTKLLRIPKHWNDFQPILILHGQPGIGKTSMALEIGHIFRPHKHVYINVAEFCEVSSIATMDDEETFHSGWSQWLENVTKPTIIVLDEYNRRQFNLVSFFKTFLKYKNEQMKLVKIIIVTEQYLLPELYKTTTVKMRGFNNIQALTLLKRSLPKLNESVILPIVNASVKSPQCVSLIAGAFKITDQVAGKVLYRLLNIKHQVLRYRFYKELKTLSGLVYELLTPTEKGCARYISKFPISFPEEAAVEILSSSGFSRPSLCLQNLVSYSLLNSYKRAGKNYYKMPKLVKKTVQEQGVLWQESAVFNVSFCKRYRRLQTRNKFMDVWQRMLNLVVQEPIEVYNQMCSGMHIGIEWVVKSPRYQLLHDIKYILTQLHLKSTNSSKMIYRECRQMGNQLNIPELTLDMIEKRYPDSPRDQCIEMFHTWIRLETGVYPVTLDGLLTMLKDCELDNVYKSYKKALKKCRNRLTSPFCSGEAWRRMEPTQKMLQLIKYADVDGDEHIFYLLQEIQLNCSSIGILFDISHNQIEAWNYQYQRNQDLLCRAILNRWIANGHDEYEVTWGGLLTVLEDAQLSDIAEQLESALGSHYNTTLPLT